MNDKCKKIISKIEQTQSYSDVCYKYLLKNIEHKGSENAFHYVMYCIDWQYMYEYNNRLTMFDILVACPNPDFRNAYAYFKAMVIDGNTYNLQENYNALKSCIKKGLKEKGISDTGKHDRKGLGEFLYQFYKKVANVDYDFSSYTQSYLPTNSLRNRFVIDFFHKFIYAYRLMCDFRSQLNPKHIGIYDIEYNRYFLLHILLRHYAQTKLYYEYHPNPLYKKEIVNGLGVKSKVVAIKTKKGTEVISSDGLFASDYINRCSKENRMIILRDELKDILSKLNDILPILSKQINTSKSPAIIYYQQELYGIEFETITSQPNLVRIGSFYPLNSTWQNKFGISKTEYNKIINKDDMQNTKYRIERPFVTKCRFVYWSILHYLFIVMPKSLKK